MPISQKLITNLTISAVREIVTTVGKMTDGQFNRLLKKRHEQNLGSGSFSIHHGLLKSRKIPRFARNDNYISHVSSRTKCETFPQTEPLPKSTKVRMGGESTKIK